MVICVPVYIFLHLSHEKIIVKHDLIHLISVFCFHFQCCCVLMWFSLKWISSNTRWKLNDFKKLSSHIMTSMIDLKLECRKKRVRELNENLRWKSIMVEKNLQQCYVDGGGSWQSNCQLSKNLLEIQPQSLRESESERRKMIV